MSVLLDFVGGVLAGQLEIELGRLAGKGLGIVNRCLDSAVDKKNHFVISVRQLAHSVMPIRICVNNPVESASVFGLDLHFGA